MLTQFFKFFSFFLLFPLYAYGDDGASFSEEFVRGSSIIILILFLYFFILRPQNKKVKDLNAAVEAMKVGSKVVVCSGIKGKVSRINKERTEFEVEIARDVKINVMRSAITAIVPEGGDANIGAANAGKGDASRSAKGGADKGASGRDGSKSEESKPEDKKFAQAKRKKTTRKPKSKTAPEKQQSDSSQA